ncbi:oligopeptide transport system ATP-binding protein [Tissierella praeacuta DSM 18095]|uniref:Oligopeptide transport system ATP-binding protein n=1 Tax=Tissierella praeacuta DSM 18095 TaxID=1123404 RepID=A0A1M4S7X3_9FIRM|nr:dipeptide ABC transporter ATP-binding protein [Tissierella praeacuta]TCU71688.1 oligopeptide transport system ATP-binding protein [Tissierella praeacuta]SHE28137.1 oligopeptide transport system ATP-binding protein [Tissierella praeacuta DSM 18095]SUP01051.1 Glutathione import ATP-binding protein GsiA [Tissierella praeacuta]
MDNVIMSVKNLKKYFTVEKSGLGKTSGTIRAVDDISFDIHEKETLALVGESGCGKSTLGRTILRLLDATAGEVYFEGKNIFELNKNEMRELRKEMQIIFQDPYASLNPRMKVVDIIGEPFITHNVAPGNEKLERVQELMELVGLRKAYASRYPHMFSGGQRQRIGIARAIALNPKFVVCDEPVSALDVSIQSQIINLLLDLQERKKLTYLFISHDLDVVRYLSNRVCVMFLGKVMELGNTDEVYKYPLHPYTKFLIAASPVPDPHTRYKEKLILEGDIPSPMNPPSGCRFHTRCPYVKDLCKGEEPETKNIDGRLVTCHYPLI